MLAAALISATCVSGHAGYYEGNDLYKHCSANPGASGYGYCIAYVAGVSDTMELWRIKEGDTECVRHSVKLGQLADVVRRYLATHPADRDKNAEMLVISAIRDAFCRKSP